MMKRHYLALTVLILLTFIAKAQNTPLVLPCSEEEILKRHLKNNPNAALEFEKNEVFIKTFIKQLKNRKSQKKEKKGSPEYTIPVVLHVFHDGDDGKIDLAQAQSGIDILNTDFNGLNADWNTIDPLFDPIKATLNIQFRLASIDPSGNPTSGVIYYDDPQAMLNKGDLFRHAWDNNKYLNIYLPKYILGRSSLFTAYAYYPSISNTNNNRDGIFYSSIRWGYGSHSELTSGQEWASVGTHELGHWLNLRHTFENGCSDSGDFVNDTPPTQGAGIQLSGCNNNNFSCGVATNGENYMDYNHDCKKMFTQGQVNRMTAALQLPSRSNLWSDKNLIDTGVKLTLGVAEVKSDSLISVYNNPSGDKINFKFKKIPTHLTIYGVSGKLIFSTTITSKFYKLDVNELASGIYFYHATFENTIAAGKFIKK